jgi:hypothetical protein
LVPVDQVTWYNAQYDGNINSFAGVGVNFLGGSSTCCLALVYVSALVDVPTLQPLDLL